MIAQFANGDARTALNTLEMAVLNGEISAEETTVTAEVLEQCISRKSLLYDKNGSPACWRPEKIRSMWQGG